MHDLLTVEEDKVAESQGWVLTHVYDMAVNQWVIRILPVAVVPQVVGRARTNDALALKALRLMTHYKGPK